MSTGSDQATIFGRRHDVLDEDDGDKANQHPHDDQYPGCGHCTLLASITLVSGASAHLDLPAPILGTEAVRIFVKHFSFRHSCLIVKNILILLWLHLLTIPLYLITHPSSIHLHTHISPVLWTADDWLLVPLTGVAQAYKAAQGEGFPDEEDGQNTDWVKQLHLAAGRLLAIF